ncbi:AraC family transcriptional regulator [Chitinophaga sp. 212800010-3]|uniref:AraC family transcriptional regulator n=1 Tax=unclassified Chitinophaga TaxID=2619133 RepID=UPI002DECD627|nr:AraC-like DNA-binding protein [Chitinophaga sp. 212800010-3]
MKATFESITAPVDQSFFVRKFEEKQFPAPYHFHPEYELTLILNGTGKRYVGNHAGDYTSGDMVLLGPNLPHCWKTDISAAEEMSRAIVVHFKDDCMGKDFFYRPELHLIATLLKKSAYGLHFTGGIADITQSLVAIHQEVVAFQRMVMLLELLQKMATSSQYLLLDEQSAYLSMASGEKERLSNVIGYIVDNFQHKISLDMAAQTANMTPNAFCRYFKKVNRKTFMEAVNDYRIDYAKKQLLSTSKSITEIGFESGFNDISNFHRAFKQRLKTSPFSYRNQFRSIQ